MSRQFLPRLTMAIAMILIGGAQASFAVVFPDPTIPEGNDTGTNQSHGKKNALYMVLRDPSASPLTQARINQIRQSELLSRQFWAADSGGKFDIYYDHIIDVPIRLNSGGALPGDWRNIADAYANAYLAQLPTPRHVNDYYSHVYDVNSSSIQDPGFTGFFFGGRDYAIRSSINSIFGQEVIDHELAHRAGAGHARAYRAFDSSSYKSYTWNEASGQYVPFSTAQQPYNPTPMGVFRDEYGNRFDVLGGYNRGGIRTRVKEENYHWLTPQQRPDLYDLGEGVHRIYAHDEFQAVVDSNGNWGANKTYDPNVYYGLTFERNAETFNTGLRRFVSTTQSIDIEYRAGLDGVLFYLDDVLLDLNPLGNNNGADLRRDLRVGSSIEDIDFGMSMFYVTGDGVDFLNYNPPPPSDPTALRGEWFHFSVLETSSDEIGSYVDLMVSLVSPLNGLVGDLNQDGQVTPADFDLFVAGWRTDTSSLVPSQKYWHGDINLDGITDLSDAGLMRNAILQHGIGQFDLASLHAVPEPSTAVLLLVGLAGTLKGRRR